MGDGDELMIYVAPGDTFTARCEGFDTGLTGTIGVRLIDSTGTTVTARTTDGITENPAGSGSYIVTLTAPTEAGQYSAFWDDGDVSPSTTAAEELTVTYTPLEAATGPSYIAVDDVKASLLLQGTDFADADVLRSVAAANAVIDQLFGRGFSKDDAPSDRYYSVRRSQPTSIDVRDLTRDTDPVVAVDAVGDGSFSTVLIENTDFVFEPLNASEDGLPYERIVMLGGRILPSGQRRVKVTATFGWPAVPPQVIAFAEVIAVKLVERFRSAPFGIVTAGADMAVAMRLARTDPDFPMLSAGLTRGAMLA